MTAVARDAAAPGQPSRGSAPRSDNLVELHDVTVDFRAGGGRLSKATRIVRAVDDVSLSIARGETLGLVGGTGSGKSTIAHLVMGMLEPTAGRVVVGGKEPRTLHGRDLLLHRQRVQVVLQDPYSSLDPRMRVGDIIAEPLTLGRVGRRRTKETQERVAELLQLVGLPPSKAALYPHQFSGGQRQRIAIARALAPRPDVIVLDEPTSALDVSVRAQILNLLKTLQEKLGVTYLVISHDLVSVAYLASTVSVMYLGRIVETGPTKAIYRAARHPYTLLLHESAPNADGAFLRILQPPVLAPRAEGIHRPEDGCRYASRCGLRARLGNPPECERLEPPLAETGTGHAAACHFAEQTARLSERASIVEVPTGGVPDLGREDPATLV